MNKPQFFVGSSGETLDVARGLADGLESLGCGEARVWNEGVFGINDEILGRLLEELRRYDFAVMVWAGDDTTQSKGRFQSSPRDNVVFECGLFMGALGRDRVFVVVDTDEKTDVKRPSDFGGILLAEYDSERVTRQRDSALRKACEQIAAKIKDNLSPLKKFEGEWRTRYVKTAEIGHAAVVDEVDVRATAGGIVITSRPTTLVASYIARGRVHANYQIIGEWQHGVTESSYAEGVFVLVVDPMVRVMYGYNTGRNETGAMVFDTWVFVKKHGLSDNEINDRLLWGERELISHTQRPSLPESSNPQ